MRPVQPLVSRASVRGILGAGKASDGESLEPRRGE